MSESTRKQQNGTARKDLDKSLELCIESGLSTLDKLQVLIDNTTTVRDLKCKIEFLSGVPSDLFELDYHGTVLTGSLFPLMSQLDGLGGVEVMKMKISPVWERFISTCLKAENSQVRARIRVKMHGVTKEERIFAACFIAARQANSNLLFGVLPSNKVITRTVGLSGRNILHAAVIGGNRNCMANILMHGGGKLINMEDIYSHTPLSIARTLSKTDIVDMLEAYKMISLRTEGSLKGTNDDDSGYECIITSQSAEETKDSDEENSEGDYELSSDEEEEEETREIPCEQNPREESHESSSVSTSRHFLDGSVAATTPNDVTARPDGSSAQLLIEQITNNKGHEKKTPQNTHSLITFDNSEADEKILHRLEQSDEGKHVGTRRESPGTSCQQTADCKSANKINLVKRVSAEKEEEEEILNGSGCKNNKDGMFAENQQEKNMSKNSTKIGWMINGNQEDDVAMVTDKYLNNGSIEGISDDSENSTKRGSHPLNGKTISSSETQRDTAVAKENKQPGDTVTTGNPRIGDQPSTMSGGNLLLRRRKKGMPSLIVSRTSGGLSSSFETLNLLDSMGRNFEVDSIAMNCDESTGATRTDDKQVCAPPIIKGPWIPKPPSSPVPIAKKRQQMWRQMFSTGSPTSGSPKFNSRSDVEKYFDEAWRRASDSDVDDSLPVPPPTRPRSYSTPHPPDPSEICKSMTSSGSKSSYKNLNAPALKTPSRRQSVGGWGRRNSVSLTFNEWLETKKEQQRRNSLVVQKERERRLSLGNQSTLRISKNINYEQWLEMKNMEMEKKASHDVISSCHGNKRSREKSEKAFKTWLQKKDEEALEKEQRLLDEAVSRRTSIKRADTLFQRSGHHSAN